MPTVQIKGAEAATEAIVRGDVLSDGRDGVDLELPPGRYIEVSFPGFETAVVAEYRVRPEQPA